MTMTGFFEDILIRTLQLLTSSCVTLDAIGCREWSISFQLAVIDSTW